MATAWAPERPARYGAPRTTRTLLKAALAWRTMKPGQRFRMQVRTIVDPENVCSLWDCRPTSERLGELLGATCGNMGETPETVLAARVKTLINAGADVEWVADANKITPLYEAAMEDHPLVVRVLVGAKARLDARTCDGRTALYVASSSGHHRVVKELIAEGANPYIAAADGSTPLSEAIDNGHAQVVQNLVGQTDTATPMRTAALVAQQLLARQPLGETDFFTPMRTAELVRHPETTDIATRKGTTELAALRTSFTPMGTTELADRPTSRATPTGPMRDRPKGRALRQTNLKPALRATASPTVSMSSPVLGGLQAPQEYQEAPATSTTSSQEAFQHRLHYKIDAESSPQWTSSHQKRQPPHVCSAGATPRVAASPPATSGWLSEYSFGAVPNPPSPSLASEPDHQGQDACPPFGELAA